MRLTIAVDEISRLRGSRFECRAAHFPLMIANSSRFYQIRSGITLAETVVVLLFMAILSAVALPKWAGSIHKYRATQAANRIVADLQRAQDAAYSSSSSNTVTFNVANSQYTISGVKPLERKAGTYSVVLSDHPYQCTLVSVWGKTGTQTLSFDGYGNPNTGGNIIVTAGSSQKTVVVDPVTGTAVVQ